MKYAAATLFAAAASAATLPRQDNLSYAVTDFTAGCIPHSVQCNYSFSTKASNTEASANCSATAQSDGSLPAIDTQTCDSTAYTFSVAPEDDGSLTFTIKTPNISGAGVVLGTYQIFPRDLETTQAGAAQVQSYTGPGDFTVPAQVTMDA